MIFLGDGDTDVPTMKMMHTKGGFSIAVYDPRSNERDQKKVYSLISEDRVNFVAAADYREGSALDLIIPKNLMPGDRSGRRYLKRMFNGLKLVTPLERAASGLVVYTQEFAISRKLMEEGKLGGRRGVVPPERLLAG